MNLVRASSPAADTAPAAGFRIVTEIETLRTLAPAWTELLADSAAPAPTLTPEWLLTWWDVYGARRRLAAGVWQEDGRLIALAPLCRTRFWHRPGIPFRRLEWLGNDVPEEDGVCSDFLNLIVRKGHEDRVIQAFVEGVIDGRFGPWDECVLGRMAGDAALTRQLQNAFRHAGHAAEAMQQDIAPYLPLQGTWEEYLAALPKRKRQGLTAALRHFEKWAGEYRLERAATADQLAAGMRILADLHRARWQGERPGVFDAPRFRAFHDRYARLLLDQKRLELAWLTAHGEPAAALYGFAADGKMCFYQCGRRLGLPSAVRLGIVMVIFALRRAFDMGLREFDFLAGHDAYKFEFTDRSRPIVSLRVARRCLPELLRRGVGAAWRMWRPKRSS